MELEINIGAIQDTLTAPFRWMKSRFRRGRSRYQRLTPAEKRLQMITFFWWMAIGAMACVALGIVLFFILFAWYSRDLPKPGQVVRRDGFSTRIYDRNGELLYDLFDEERRVPVTIDQIPETLKQATIATEDKDFYKHQGFDFLTIVRIPYNLIVRRRVVGGSTLTQQLVKNVLLTNERSLPRKFREFVLSLQIERTFTKDQILEMYLNEAPYGGTAWGVGTASEIYFNKPVSQVTLTESVILAGLPQRPSAYSPYSGKSDENGEPLWKMRAKGVLRRMKEDGYVTDLAYEQSLSELDTIVFQRAKTEIKAPHFVFFVRDKLIEMYGEELTEKGGLKVTTTLDLPLHAEAQKIVAEEIEKVLEFNITNGAAMVTNPKTGEILSMVGSKDYFAEDIDGQYNVAADGLRQPGSSIKPLTYLGLFKMGYTPASMLMDVETTFAANQVEKPYNPKNYDGKFHGPVNLRTALGSSLNIPAVKGVGIVGVENFLQLAYDMGFPTLEPSEENLRRLGLSVTLGGGEVHLIDTVTAYSAFANGGRKVEPVAILKVEDSNGKLLFEHRPVDGREVITPEEAYLINNVLSDNNARLLAFGANSLLNTGKAIAVKTGTTNDRRDNWTIGWSQEVMVGVWVGNNDNSEMTRVASGITGASPIWRKIIDHALKNGFSAPDWERPENVEEVTVDAVSGYPAHDDLPSRKDIAIKGTLPALPDPINTKLKVCKGENKLATDAKIASADYDEKNYFVFKESDPVSKDGINRWQQGIDAWVGAQTDDKYKPPTEYCGEQSDVSVRLVKPENERTFSTEDVEVAIDADSGDGIEKIEIWVDGSLKETINNRSYRGTIKLSAGQHEIYAKAKGRNGKEVESNRSRIGTGGQEWKRPEPSPSPSPTPQPSPSASPSPSPSPSASPVALPSPSVSP
ncbi:MAG TPA: transglycosylase domain-containing protein [Vitreimonas sp.]|nr:transglycosylase domain-containing protein [Vitreimonas sp.]